MSALHTRFLPCTGDRPGAAEHLVLLPGWSMPAAVFEPLLPVLQQRFHLTLIDLPGAGANASVDTGTTLSAMAAVVMDALPLHAHLFGWSLGGMVAACIAANEPQRVQSLVTVAANLSFVQRAGWSTAMAPDTFAAFERDVAADAATALPRFTGLQAQGSATAREDLRRLRAALATQPLPPTEHLLNGLAVLHDADLRPFAEGIRCPSLWLFGAQDVLVPAAAAEAVARRLPSARTVVLPGAAHAPFASAPGSLLEHLHFLHAS